jgi:uncharacterized membrane protein YdbT with pleckstrin-like domain
MGNIGLQEILIIAIVVGLFGLIPYIFYLIELQNTLKEVKFENQKMKPGKVWLLFIPLFSAYWYFEVVSKIADSLEAEFEERKIQLDEVRPGYSIGIVMCIIGVITLCINIFSKLFNSLVVIMAILNFLLGLA